MISWLGNIFRRSSVFQRKRWWRRVNSQDKNQNFVLFWNSQYLLTRIIYRPNRCCLRFDRYGRQQNLSEAQSLPDASVSSPLLSPEESHPANYDSNSIWEGHTDWGIIPARMSGRACICIWQHALRGFTRVVNAVNQCLDFLNLCIQ